MYDYNTEISLQLCNFNRSPRFLLPRERVKLGQRKGRRTIVLKDVLWITIECDSQQFIWLLDVISAITYVALTSRFSTGYNSLC